MNRIIKKQEEYLDKKINGNGATYITDTKTGRIICDWIYGKNKLQLLFINIKLSLFSIFPKI